MTASAVHAATAAADSGHTNLSFKQWAGLIAAPVVCLALWFAPTHDLPEARHAIAVSALMIILFVTEPVDHAIAGFIGVFLFWALGVVGPEEAFSGFASETPWFLLGAILIGTMASKSGFAQRIAYGVVSRIGSSYSRLLLGFIVVDFLLTFLIPSGIARVVIMASVAIGVVDAFGLVPKSNLGRGLFIVITYTAAIFDKMIIAGAASILARGIIQDVGQVRVLYSQWLIAYLPCDLLTIFCCWRLILWMYPPEKDGVAGQEHFRFQLKKLGPWSASEKKCAAYIFLAVALWMTDFVHHINPSMVGLAVGLLGVMPYIGVLNTRDVRGLNFSPIWFTAAALTMGRVLMKTKGLEVLTNVLVGWVEPIVTSNLSSAAVLYWTGFVYHFFLANETAMLSTSLPIVLKFAQNHGLNPLPIGMIWTFASGGKIFIYQSAVIMVGYAYGYFEAKDMLKVGLILTAVESLILLLLVPLYWPLVGIS